jgi:hypothetical protein
MQGKKQRQEPQTVSQLQRSTLRESVTEGIPHDTEQNELLQFFTLLCVRLVHAFHFGASQRLANCHRKQYLATKLGDHVEKR